MINTNWIRCTFSVVQVNDVKNIMVGRMSSEEFTEAWQAKRAVRRLEGIDRVACMTMLTVYFHTPI